jgi:hypothetical protein
MLGYIKSADPIPKCNKIPDFCLTPAAVGDGKCDTCNTDFIKSTDQLKCFPKINGCKTYQQISGRCTECDANFVITGNGIACIEIPLPATPDPNCDAYDDISWGCKLCKPTFELSVPPIKCVTSKTDCLAVSPEDKCIHCVNGKIPNAAGTCDPLDILTTAAPKLLLTGSGHIIFNSGANQYCLVHGIKPSSTFPFDDASATAAMKAVSFFPCEKADYELSLWKIQKLDGSDLAANDDYLDPSLTLGATSPQIAIAAAFPHKDPSKVSTDTTKVTLGGTTYDKFYYRLKATLTGGLVLAHDSYTVFNLQGVAATSLAQSVFHKGFNLVIFGQKSVATPGATSPWVGADPASATDASLDKGKFVIFNVATTPVPVKTAIVSATATSGAYFLYKKMEDNQLSLTIGINQIVRVVDEFVNIEWLPIAPRANLQGIFPVLMSQTAKLSTPSVCNFRYPELNPLPFHGQYKIVDSASFDPITGLPKEDLLLKISLLNLPIFELIKCGFAISNDATGISSLMGRIGYFSDSLNKGFYQDLEIKFDTQTAIINDLKIDNIDSFETFKLDIPIKTNAVFRTRIRFYNDNTLTKELNPLEKRGVVVSTPTTFVLVELLNSQGQPLKDQYLFVNFKVYLQTSFTTANGATTVTQELTPATPVKTKPNTLTFSLDLKRVPSGIYKFGITFNVAKSAAKRMLVEDDLKKSAENLEAIHDELKEIKGLTENINLQLNANNGVLLNLNFWMLISMILLVLIWKN